MWDYAVTDSEKHPPRVDPTTVTRLPLPSHITVWAAAEHVAVAEHIAVADCWLADS
jgi:hypothetical protein